MVRAVLNRLIHNSETDDDLSLAIFYKDMSGADGAYLAKYNLKHVAYAYIQWRF
jgi:hypothetical protein